MDFVYPQYLRLMAGVPVLMLLWAVGLWHHQRMRSGFGDLTNLRGISRVSGGGRGWMRGGLFTASLIAMVLGLAYPQLPGREVRPVVERFIDGMPRRFDVATEDVRMSAALIEISASMAKAEKIELVTVRK